MNTSVIICTHNPREAYLRRVLDALALQTLPLDQWELIVIDNASDESVAEKFDISWHPNGRHVLERELGLTPARLRGIAEAKGELLVFVDDDNILSRDYLATAYEIANAHPFLGAWGGGIVPEFEVEPSLELVPYLGALALRDVPETRWSNVRDDQASQPFGAGLCVRGLVARRHAETCQRSSIQMALGRRGLSLMSGEDMDMVLGARYIGLGWGVFESLSLIHLIPSSRLRLPYLLHITEGISASGALLGIVHDGKLPKDPTLGDILGRCARVAIRKGFLALRFELARLKGVRMAVRLANGIEAENTREVSADLSCKKSRA